ncbi:hypothetical protein ACWGLF_30620 [Streptomyces puniciscabiei]
MALRTRPVGRAAAGAVARRRRARGCGVRQAVEAVEAVRRALEAVRRRWWCGRRRGAAMPPVPGMR